MKTRYKILRGILGFLVVAVAILAFTISRTTECGPAPTLSDDVETMQAIVYRCYGSPDVLEYAQVAKPSPKDDEILVRVKAASVNPLDWHFMRGSPYFMRLGSGLGAPEDTRMGTDFAGTVEEVGAKITQFKPGDDIFGGGVGAFGEYIIVPEGRSVASKPANVSIEQAASIPIAGITALQALRDRGKVKPGQKVLINGASGGVGTFAVQIGKWLGADVTGVCSTRNVEMVLSLGADHVIDYKKESYVESGERYDVIIDMVGNHSLLANRKALAPEGKLVMIGAPKGNWLGPLKGPIKAMLYSPFVDQDIGLMIAVFSQDDLNILADLVKSGEVTPVIDRRYTLSETPDAIRYSEEGHARGKIIITVE